MGLFVCVNICFNEGFSSFTYQKKVIGLFVVMLGTPSIELSICQFKNGIQI